MDEVGVHFSTDNYLIYLLSILALSKDQKKRYLEKGLTDGRTDGGRRRKSEIEKKKKRRTDMSGELLETESIFLNKD